MTAEEIERELIMLRSVISNQDRVLDHHRSMLKALRGVADVLQTLVHPDWKEPASPIVDTAEKLAPLAEISALDIPSPRG